MAGTFRYLRSRPRRDSLVDMIIRPPPEGKTALAGAGDGESMPSWTVGSRHGVTTSASGGPRRERAAAGRARIREHGVEVAAARCGPVGAADHGGEPN